MHLRTVRASAAKLSRNSHLLQDTIESYFFPKIISPSPLKRPFPPPFVSRQWNCNIPWYVGGQAIIDFQGR